MKPQYDIWDGRCTGTAISYSFTTFCFAKRFVIPTSEATRNLLFLATIAKDAAITLLVCRESNSIQ
jgi:hypothetical protein